MEQKIYHGTIKPRDFAQTLIAQFNRGNYRVQKIGDMENMTVQIATHEYAESGGQTAISIELKSVEDGVMVRVGQQVWYGVAASLGWSALAALVNPLNLLDRIDDIAQDIESLKIVEEIWQVIDATARTSGAGQELSERFRRVVCTYCNTANPVGEGHCIACGAPLGDSQPETCKRCGYILKKPEKICPQCGQIL